MDVTGWRNMMDDKNELHNAISLLTCLRGRLCCDNDASLKYGQRGKQALKIAIDRATMYILTLDRELSDATETRDIFREICKRYDEVWGDYDLDNVTDERKAELRALIEKWEREDDDE